MISNHVDFEVSDRAGRTAAFIEVKNVPQLTSAFAADVRRGLFFEDEEIASPPAYFLVLSQDQAFLWEPKQADEIDSEPAATFPMRQILREYLSDALLTQHLREAELDIAVLQWISDLAGGRASTPSEPPSLANFAARIRGGAVHGGPRP
jgi:hypothetical protein